MSDSRKLVEPLVSEVLLIIFTTRKDAHLCKEGSENN